jgi:hypothetical protein
MTTANDDRTGGAMTPSPVTDELALARIADLLERLDPAPRPVCQVPGCTHDAHALPAAA